MTKTTADQTKPTPDSPDILDNRNRLLERVIGEKDPTVLPALIDLLETMNANASRRFFYVALSAFQADSETIGKTQAVKGSGGQGGTRYKFAPLDQIMEAVRPLLGTHGLSVTFKSNYEPDTRLLRVTCCVMHVWGWFECSDITLPVGNDGFMNAAQHMGSALTYGRRYTLCAALGIAVGDEDDDAQGGDRQQSRSQGKSEDGVDASGGAAVDNRAVIADINKAAAALGYDAPKVRNWINRKYQVTGGFDSLKPGELREVLKIFREQVIEAGKSRGVNFAGMSGTPSKDAGTDTTEKPSQLPTSTTTAEELEPADGPENALSAGAKTTLRSVMKKAGLTDEQFHDRYGFGLDALRATDVKKVHAWIKEAEKK